MKECLIAASRAIAGLIFAARGTRARSRKRSATAYRSVPLVVFITVVAIASRSAALAAATAGDAPDVLLIVVDTLRADHLGCYGYPRPTSPNVDALAARGVLFERTVAQAPWTTPSVASIFTGKLPLAHGAIGSVDGKRQAVLAADQVTLAESFKEGGYRTAAYVTNPNIVARLGFDQGFDTYEEHMLAPASSVTDWALAQLAQRDDRPLFLYLHYMDPHSPYSPPGPQRQKLTTPANRGRLRKIVTTETLQQINFAGYTLTPTEADYLVGLYDAEIAYADQEIGRLVAELDARDLLEAASPLGRLFGSKRKAVLALTADHGEELLDHGGVFHGFTAYRELTHVPLVLVGPTIPQKKVGRLTRSIDIRSTLLDLSGIGPEAGQTSESLRPFFSGDAADRPALTQAEMLTRQRPVKLRAVETAEWKYVEDEVAMRSSLYNLRTDPMEQHDLLEENPEQAAVLKQQLQSLQTVPAAPSNGVELDAETRERLRQLGY